MIAWQYPEMSERGDEETGAAAESVRRHQKGLPRAEGGAARGHCR